MKRTAILRKVALKPGGFLRASRGKRIKSRGMVGRTPTVAEKLFMDAMASLGCLACLKDGRVNPWVSLHHISGRTAPGAHFSVLSLCAPHHQQDDTDPLKRASVHGRKATFTALYGTEYELLDWARAKLGLVDSIAQQHKTGE